MCLRSNELERSVAARLFEIKGYEDDGVLVVDAFCSGDGVGDLEEGSHAGAVVVVAGSVRDGVPVGSDDQGPIILCAVQVARQQTNDVCTRRRGHKLKNSFHVEVTDRFNAVSASCYLPQQSEA